MGGLLLGGLVNLANWEFSYPPAPPLHAARYLLAGVGDVRPEVS